MYVFTERLPSNIPYTLPCVYNNRQNATRACVSDVRDGPRWQPIDLTACLAESEATQKLEELEQVPMILIINYFNRVRF